MHETSAQDWCTLRDGMGKEGGGGIRMGNTCKSMADLCKCMAKTTTIISLQLIKINRKKKNSIRRHENFSTFSETEKKIKKKIKADREKRKITDKD